MHASTMIFCYSGIHFSPVFLFPLFVLLFSMCRIVEDDEQALQQGVIQVCIFDIITSRVAAAAQEWFVEVSLCNLFYNFRREKF